MICTVKRKPGLSRDGFREYYEESHAPLAAGLLPALAGYARSYVIPESLLGVPGLATPLQPDFDGLTEIWLERLEDPELAKTLTEDEGKLIDRTQVCRFLVEERVTLFDAKRPTDSY
jgi:hypothetical protein